MRLELLAFDLLVLGPPLVASFGLLGRSAFFLDRWRRAWPSALIASVPGLCVLAWLTASGAIEWSTRRSLAPGLGPLAIDAVLLVPAVAFACLFVWWVGFAEPREAPPSGPARAPYALGLLVRPRFWGFLGTVALATLLCGGALIEREIVGHGRGSTVGFALIGVPIEDFGFALALAGSAVLVFEWLEIGALARPRKSWIARWIERKFGGYRHALNPVDEGRPTSLSQPRSVAIVGAGLAGLGAASRLAARGFAVTLFERNSYIGGKLGAWKTTMPDGREIGMSHGFHAFFHHYYNLNQWFAELGIDRGYRNIGDYLILTADGRTYSFKDVATTPMLNLLSLARHGVYDLREVAGRHTGPKMEALLRYDPVETFAEYDGVSYAQFADDARLPESLRLVFTTFSRAFFADPDKMSLAELIKSFHFYYLSNDGGLIYEHLDDDYERSLLAPLREHLSGLGVTIHTNCEISQVVCGDDGRYQIGGETFDELIIASDVVGTRALFERSPTLVGAAPRTAGQVATLAPGQRYVVVRLWLDRGVEASFPGFIITERVRLLDAVTFVHQIERESTDWVEQRKAAGQTGAVLELHCYAVPESLTESDAQLCELMIAEMHHFFPELANAEIVHSYCYVRRDFPGFHVGKHATRPSWETERDTLYLAGDWVVLPFPAMLMEAAYSAGLLAANAICKRAGVREYPMWTVPLRGFMAGWPKRPF